MLLLKAADELGPLADTLAVLIAVDFACELC